MLAPEAADLSTPRWHLYKSLSDPFRLQLLALAAEQELSVGELAQLLEASQPKVSRQVSVLREQGLLITRKEGTFVWVRLEEGVSIDPVVQDALSAGKRLCEDSGSLRRVVQVVSARDQHTREFFAGDRAATGLPALPSAFPAYLKAMAMLLPRAELAVDVGTGDGALLEILAPMFRHVVAVDREARQLQLAAARLNPRDYNHVSYRECAYTDPALADHIQNLGGADVVFAARVLHHAPEPEKALRALVQLLVPGGHLVVLDYAAHHDEELRERQADIWLGFDAEELRTLASRAGLEQLEVTLIPAGLRGDGPDSHLPWQVLSGRKKEQD